MTHQPSWLRDALLEQENMRIVNEHLASRSLGHTPEREAVDIVEELRNWEPDPSTPVGATIPRTLIWRAADEIERLRAQLEDASTEIQILELMTEGSTREQAERSVL